MELFVKLVLTLLCSYVLGWSIYYCHGRMMTMIGAKCDEYGGLQIRQSLLTAIAFYVHELLSSYFMISVLINKTIRWGRCTYTVKNG